MAKSCKGHCRRGGTKFRTEDCFFKLRQSNQEASSSWGKCRCGWYGNQSRDPKILRSTHTVPLLQHNMATQHGNATDNTQPNTQQTTRKAYIAGR
eukprot:scaffold10986_cov88-Amphora_coffeaeformis.AAC.2